MDLNADAEHGTYLEFTEAEPFNKADKKVQTKGNAHSCKTKY